MATADSDCVTLETEGAIAFLTISRPKAMNALNVAVINRLEEAFISAEADDGVKAVVLRGAGEVFVAGADIRFFRDHINAGTVSAIEAFARKGHEVFLRIENSPKQTIALLDGLSLGGGSELALACNAIVATENGSLGFPETGIGIYPGLGGMLRFAKKTVPALAKYYVFTGTTLSAREALSLGIVEQVVAPGDIPRALNAMAARGKIDKYAPRSLPDAFRALAAAFAPDRIEGLLAGGLPEGLPEDQAAKIAKRLKAKAPLALRAVNDIIDAQSGVGIEAGIALELAPMQQMFLTADALEGLSSAGKRRPEFTGT